MSKLRNAVIICFIVNLYVYFYSGSRIILYLLIIIFVFVLSRAVEFRFIKSFKKTGNFLKENYKKQRINMSNTRNNLNTPERNQSVLGSGLFKDYESRLGLHRLSLKSNTSLSEKPMAKSPSRSYNFSKLHGDENFVSNCRASYDEDEMPSPIRSGASSFRSSPLSYSKRFNTNSQSSDHQNSAYNLNNPRVSLLLEKNSFSESFGSPHSMTRRSSNCEEKCPSTFAGRMITVANQMDCNQFPWIAYNGSIPMILSNSHRSPSPLGKMNSSSDASGSFRNRVRVRLSKPIKSNVSILNSDVDNSSNLDESSTTKSVIQVLKEIARKRCLATDDEEDEHEGLPQAKRRTEHNLYLSRLEGEEEDTVSESHTRINGEDERTKRTREPDWDTPNISKPKRPRKNYNFVNNEIISSLSSSIGLHVFKHNERKRSTRKSIAVQVQTLVPEETNKEKKEKVLSLRSSLPLPSPPKTRDTGVLTDPLPEPRPRSPVKEKAVSDINGILKSALTKFDIQPSTLTTESDITTITPTSSSVPTIPISQSTIATGSPSTSLITPFSSSNQTVISSSTSIQTSASSSFSLAVSKSTFTPVSSPNPFMVPVSSPQLTFGIPSVLSEKTIETSKAVEKEDKLVSVPKVNEDKVDFKLESKQIMKSESPFKFGVPLSDSNVKLSGSQPKTATSGLFNFKVPETSAPVQAPTTSSPVFTFGIPKVQEPAVEVKKAEEQKSIFESAITSTAASLSSPVTSVLLTQKSESSPLAVKANNYSDQKDESLKSTSGFSFQSKLTEQMVSSKEEKKEVLSSGIFSFGKSENKSLTDSKPFQFGSGGFTFGQANKGNSGESSSNAVSASVSSTSSTVPTQAAFSFSSGAPNKDEKPGGFTFNSPVKTSNEQKKLFSFNSSSASSLISAPSSFVPTTTVASAKPAYPNSLFGNSIQNSSALTSTIATTCNSLAKNSSIATASFGTTSKTPAPTFGLNSTTGSAPTFGLNTATSSTPTFGSTAAPKSVFGGGSNPPTFGNTINNGPVFGSNVKNENNKPPSFGSNATSNSSSTSAFGIGVPSTSSSVPTFGSVAAGNNSSVAFGSTAVGNTNQPGFGVTATGGSNNSSFGSSAGNLNVPTFGSTLASGTVPATFGSTPSNGAAPSQPLFGSSAVGSSAGTNNAPSFGSTPAFGSSGSVVPTFGASTSSTFGSSTLATPTFGNQPQQNFGNQTGTSFGGTPAFGQASSTPAFGTQSTFVNPSTSTPAFGSSQTFGSSGSTFGSSSVPAATPTFGVTTTPAFGSSTAFGNQDTNKPFTFNAPAPQPAQTGTFNFTAPQSQQGSGGLFQFGAGSTGTSGNQPFQFNASQSSTPGFTAGFSPGVGGTSQQMFSIGSGSTAARRMTGRRKK